VVAALAIGLTIGEVVAITAGVAVLLQRDGYEPREALPVALVSALGLLSFAAQSVFLAGVPRALPALEAAMVIGGLLAIRRHGMEGRLLAAMRAHLHAEWKTWAVVAPAWAYLAAAAVFIPESNFDSMRYNLARVLLFEQEGTLLLPYVSDWSQVVFPVGGDLLRHYVLRFGTDFGLALFNVAALVAMATGSYALGRAVATRAAALTAMLVLSGAPLVVYQATGTKPDLLAAAVACASLVVTARIQREPRAVDLLLLACLLAFGVSIKTTFLAVGAPLAVAVAVGLRRRRPLPGSWSAPWYAPAAALALVAVLSQSWLFVHNWRTWGSWAGPRPFAALFRHEDSLTGTAANLVRYGVQSFQVLSVTDAVARGLVGRGPGEVVEGLYRKTLEPVLGLEGMSRTRGLSRLEIAPPRSGDGENGAWFGPLGLMVVGPCVVLALARGPAPARVAAVVAVSSVVLIARFVAWMPWNGRFFSASYAATAPCVAWAIDWYLSGRRVQGVLRALACAVLYYACCFNQAKDLVRPSDVLEVLGAGRPVRALVSGSVWYRTRFGLDRAYFWRSQFGDDRVALVSRELPAGSRVAMVTRWNAWVFPFLQSRRDVRFLPVPWGEALPAPVDYVLCINVQCPPDALPPGARVLWSVPASPSVRAGTLARVAP